MILEPPIFKISVSTPDRGMEVAEVNRREERKKKRTSLFILYFQRGSACFVPCSLTVGVYPRSDTYKSLSGLKILDILRLLKPQAIVWWRHLSFIINIKSSVCKHFYQFVFNSYYISCYS